MEEVEILVIDADANSGVDSEAERGWRPGLSTRELVASYREILAHDYGSEVAIRFVDWPDLREVDEECFLEAHRHRQRGEKLPYVYVDRKLYWTGGLSLREIMAELESRGVTRQKA